MSTTYRVAIGVDDSGAITQIDQLEAKAEKSDKYVNNSVAMANTQIGTTNNAIALTATNVNDIEARSRAALAKIIGDIAETETAIDESKSDLASHLALSKNKINEFDAEFNASLERSVENYQLRLAILKSEKDAVEAVIGKVVAEKSATLDMLEKQRMLAETQVNATVDNAKKNIEMTRRQGMMVGNMAWSMVNMVFDAMGISLGVVGNVISSVISAISAVSMIASTEASSPWTMAHGAYMIVMAAASLSKAMEAERKRQQSENELSTVRTKIQGTSLVVMM